MTDDPAGTVEQSPPEPAPGKGGSGSALRGAGWVFLVVLLVLYTLYERASVLQAMERVARDFAAQTRSPRESHDVFMVRIDSADYVDLFARRSPLDVDSLEKVLEVIVASRPRVVVVDVLTDEPAHRRLATLDDSGVPVVWVRATGACEAKPYPRCTGLSDFAGLDRDGSRFGMGEVSVDPDGVIRQYRRFVEVDDSLRPTVAASVMDALGPPLEASADPYFIHYRPMKYEGVSVTASQLLDFSREPGFFDDSMLRDRIVFLGGSFAEARDEYQTPVGEMYGVDVHAQIVLTEMEGGGLEPVGMRTIGVLLFLNSLGLLLWFHFTSDFKLAFWVSVLAIPVFATLCSWLLSKSWFALWPYLIPLLVVLLIQQLYAQAIRYRNDLLEELADRWVSGRMKRSLTDE